jgi:hypothetical protein
MISLAPDVNVAPAEFQRLLGYPRDYVLEGRALDLADEARAWYARHGTPWIYAREAASIAVEGATIRIEGEAFHSTRLARTLSNAEAEGAVLVAVGAGPEVEEQTQKLWNEEKPDEYFFLEMFSSAVVEHLTTLAGARLCGWADSVGRAVLPHYSPGYPEWDIAEQPRLLELFRPSLPYPLEVLESGMLRPKKSLLAVFGLTRRIDKVRRLTDLVPCQNCSFHPCQFRRAPYGRTQTLVPLVREANYGVNRKALRRWAAERLSLEHREDGIDAVFRYDGTTCTNMGQPLAFYYGVKLGPREEGYPIREQWCGPAPGDTGHTYMCRYRTDPGSLMAAIAADKPLLGRRLDEVLTWKRDVCSAGCYCEPASREHKWGLVLETIHYALAQSEPLLAARP